jgi:hypothetical protein
VKTADGNFKELQVAYDTIATGFHLPTGLMLPLIPVTTALELALWEYEHVVNEPAGATKITVTSPYKAVMVYAGYAPRRLANLLNDLAGTMGSWSSSSFTSS